MSKWAPRDWFLRRNHCCTTEVKPASCRRFSTAGTRFLSDRAKAVLPAGASTGTSAPAQRRGGFLGVRAHNTNSSGNYHFQLGEENCLMSSLLHVEKNVQESDFRSVLIPVQKAIHSQVLIAERRDPYSQGSSSEGLSPMSFNSPLSF